MLYSMSLEFLRDPKSLLTGYCNLTRFLNFPFQYFQNYLKDILARKLNDIVLFTRI